jgi:hypothetical protein
VARVEQRSRWPGWADWLVPLAALALGAASNIIDGRRLSIVAFPMLGMLLWNLAVYLMLIASPLGRLARRRRPPGCAVPPAAGVDIRAGKSRRLRPAAAGQRARPLPEGLAVLVPPLTNSRAARLFHLSAAALAIGLLAGMYWRALGTEYRAGWESTLLGRRRCTASST